MTDILTGLGMAVCGVCRAPFIPERSSQKYCAEHSHGNGYIKQTRAKHHLTFIGVDGEGLTLANRHEYVLLGVGDQQREWPDGLHNITEAYEFLYSQFLRNPTAVYAGYYLGYDYNMWLRCLPRERADILMGATMVKRQRKQSAKYHLPPFAVEYKGWKFDILGYKRLMLRPKPCRHEYYCECPVNTDWMYICDAGPFFQTSLLKAVDPAKWSEPVVTQEEYELLKKGKARRDHAVLDDEMRYYNRLENKILARMLTKLNEGFVNTGIRLNRRQWFGPGQAAQAWLGIGKKLAVATQTVREFPEALTKALIASYYAGWMELPCHGHIGTAYEYDRNSSYPHTQTQLPCPCGKWVHLSKRLPKPSQLALIHLTVLGKDPWLGPLPHRIKTGAILRPRLTEGWHWWHEIQAAKRAGLIDKWEIYESWVYDEPCDHPPPLQAVGDLYNGRLAIGKNTPTGIAYKLVANSAYGKLAQSIGNPKYANVLYASLITSGTRIALLDAIATHPDKSAAVAMIATDGIYFTSPHPGLPLSDKLGEWSLTIREGLTVFKPGVYWDDKAREAIRNHKDIAFKARGINCQDFAAAIARIDQEFTNWDNTPPALIQWPKVEFTSNFEQISVKEALHRTHYIKDPDEQAQKYQQIAGLIIPSRLGIQDSDPSTKRDPLTIEKIGGVYRTRPWAEADTIESVPYHKSFGVTLTEDDIYEGTSEDGTVMMGFREILGINQ